MKKIKNYFSHDFGARNDKKLEKVRFKLGLEGVGLYWCIIECLYENAGYLSLEDDIDLLAYQLRVDKNLIVDLIENYDLFKKNKNKFYSQSVLNRLEEISNKSEQNRKNVLKRWGKIKEKQGNESNANVIQEKYENDTTVLETNYYKKENKKKENKINKNILLTTTEDNNIYNYVEQNFGRPLSPIELEKISLWSSEYKEDILKEAINTAVFNRKSTFAYVEGILKNWKAKGFQTLEEIKQDNLEGWMKTHPREDKKTEIDPDIFDYNWLTEHDDED